MATSDHTAQFQEPPVFPLPTHKDSNASENDITSQFQEPIPPQASNNPSSGHKSTTEKIKEKVKKPFASEDEVRSPELEAAVEVIEKKGMAAN